MIAILSPAKSLSFHPGSYQTYSSPRLTGRSNELIRVLRTKSEDEVMSLMNISEKLASLNVERYHAFASRHTSTNSMPCLYAFTGDVYRGLKAGDLTESEVEWAQSHLRILSGLYGLLRPLDLIQAYRLEMGTRLAFDDYKTLYDFWEDEITSLLNKDLKKQGDNILINLASQEYYKSIDRASLDARVVDVEFKDFKDDGYKLITFYAKKARGMMARYIIKNRIDDVEDLKGFDYKGYYFDDRDSTERKLAFKRG